MLVIFIFYFIILSVTFLWKKEFFAQFLLFSKMKKIIVTASAYGLITQWNKKNSNYVLKVEVLLEYNPKLIESTLRATEESIRGLEQSNRTLIDALKSRN